MYMRKNLSEYSQKQKRDTLKTDTFGYVKPFIQLPYR